MEIPRYIKKNGVVYEFTKRYPSFFMYENKETGIKVCMDAFDLIGRGLRTQKKRSQRWEV